MYGIDCMGSSSAEKQMGQKSNPKIRRDRKPLAASGWEN